MNTHDIIDIGLGTVGSATCMELARRGRSVLGLDTLVGVVSKYGILIVEFANKPQLRGLDKHAAIL